MLAHDRFLAAGEVGEDMVIPAIADVILAMRKDVSDEATNLRTIDVLQTFIKNEDIDKMRPLCDKWERDKAKAWPLSRSPVKR